MWLPHRRGAVAPCRRTMPSGWRRGGLDGCDLAAFGGENCLYGHDHLPNRHLASRGIPVVCVIIALAFNSVTRARANCALPRIIGANRRGSKPPERRGRLRALMI